VEIAFRYDFLLNGANVEMGLPCVCRFCIIEGPETVQDFCKARLVGDSG
jgi:hypothetical protein